MNLTLDFNTSYEVGIGLKGVSFKSTKQAYNFGHRLIRNEQNKYVLSFEEWHVDGRTARIKKSFLVEMLKELYEVIPFTGVKIKGRYELSGEEIFNEIK